MGLKRDLEKQVMLAARENGMGSVLYRNAVARKLGLNSTDWDCLSLLTIKGATSPKELSRYTGLTTSSTTALLDRLEKAQFIERKPNPKDRRGILIQINPKWTEAAGPLVKGVQQAHTDLIASYSDEELKTIADFLERFTKNVIDQTTIIENEPGLNLKSSKL